MSTKSYEHQSGSLVLAFTALCGVPRPPRGVAQPWGDVELSGAAPLRFSRVRVFRSSNSTLLSFSCALRRSRFRGTFSCLMRTEPSGKTGRTSSSPPISSMTLRSVLRYTSVRRSSLAMAGYRIFAYMARKSRRSGPRNEMLVRLAYLVGNRKRDSSLRSE